MHAGNPNLFRVVVRLGRCHLLVVSGLCLCLAQPSVGEANLGIAGSKLISPFTEEPQEPAAIVQGDPVPAPQEPAIAAASHEGVLAMSAITLPPDVSIALFAAEPDVANPVAIDVDQFGNVFVCESFRQERGVEDNRNHPEWLLDDLSARSVAERLAYMEKHLGDKLITYTAQDDRIRLLRDTTGDGAADVSEIFASGFNRPEDGTGAGVLRIRNQVWYTCIPHLWLFDIGEDGSITRKPVHSGFGVRFAFRGHDLHGLTLGPDGRLYFTIGDRGYNVNNQVVDVESGAVFRCELDGSQLEVVATGLRNPQSLAFDDFGNLFTCDNNSDSGVDQARLIYVVEGADYGWRMQYQYMPDRGPYIREGIWDPHNQNRPAYTVPAISTLGDGPSGLTYYPGTGWSDDYRGRFFLCDFRGQANLSGIRTFSVEPQGASFRLKQEEQTIWNVLATDVDFGPDGRLYISDWVESWDGVGKGRIYTLTHQASQADSVVDEVASLLKQGLTNHSPLELSQLLSHPDQRIRIEAQFELVRRQEFDEMLRNLERRSPLFAQLHAVWGIGQMLRFGFTPNTDQNRLLTARLETAMLGGPPEVRCQVCRLIGEQKITQLTQSLVIALTDENHHVRFHAVIALSKVAGGEKLDDIHQFIARNDDQDQMITHAGIMAMYHIVSEYQQRLNETDDQQEFLRNHPINTSLRYPSLGVHSACIVALRKLRSPLFGAGIGSQFERVALESARTIYEMPRRKPMQDMAMLLNRSPHRSTPFVRRLLHANFLLGGPENCTIIGRFIENSEHDLELRVEAMNLLADWLEPEPLDKVNGRVRYLGTRTALPVRMVLMSMWPKIKDQPEELRLAFVTAARNVKASPLARTMAEIVSDETFSLVIRESALFALAEFNPQNASELLQGVINSEHSDLRRVAIRILSQSNPQQVLPVISSQLDSESQVERQYAFQTLSQMKDPGSLKLVRLALKHFDSLPADSRLDAYLAAQTRSAELGPKELSELEQSLANAPHGVHELTLTGGDATAGEKVYQQTELSCVRCHKVGAVGGNIGPELTRIGAEKDRDYLLRSLIRPNHEIAENFGSIMILDTDGNSHIGIIKSQDQDQIQLMDDQGTITVIQRNAIEEMKDTKSAMPEDLIEKLTLSEIRDLMEYLSNLK